MNESAILAVRWRPGDARGRKTAEDWLQRAAGDGVFSELLNRRGFRLLVRQGPYDGAPLILPDEGGVVLGALFAASDGVAAGAIKTVDADAPRIWCESTGAALHQHYWGNYLVVLSDRARDRVLIARTPSGARACYLARRQDFQILFTDAADFLRATPLEVDDEALGMFLAGPRLVIERTPLRGVVELSAGSVTILGRDGVQRAQGWRPAPAPSPRPARIEAAAARLRGVIEDCAAAWSKSGPRIVHRLSGGLDSSIVLAALRARAPKLEIICVNERPLNAPEGDERPVARIVAARFGCGLREIAFDPAEVRYERLLAHPPSARPSLSELSFADPTFMAALGDQAGCVLTSGQGGDQVLQRAFGADMLVDAVRDGIGLGELRELALWIARANRRSVWDITRQALEVAFAGERAHVRAQLMRMAALSETEAKPGAEAAAAHPWLSGRSLGGPARAARAINLIDLQYYFAPSQFSAHFQLAPILASAPVLDVVRGLAPHLMCWGGVDRALARRAFADVLPEQVQRRTLKGDVTRYVGAVVNANRDFLGDALMQGRLVARGLLTRAEIASDLDGAISVEAIFRLTTRACAELWLRRAELHAASGADAG